MKSRKAHLNYCSLPKDPRHLLSRSVESADILPGKHFNGKQSSDEKLLTLYKYWKISIVINDTFIQSCISANVCA